MAAPTPAERAQLDQDAAAMDEMVAQARKHRTGHCVSPEYPCVGDLVLTLHGMSKHNLVVAAAHAISRLADLPAPPITIEGIAL
jgi:hypothetical protein